MSVASLLEAEHAENEIRKDFTPTERKAIADAIEAELGERRGGDRKSSVANATVDPYAGRRNDEIAAEKAGFSSTTQYRQAKTVTERAEPELVEAMDRRSTAINTWARLLRIVEDQAGTEARERIEARILGELRGTRLHVPKRRPLTAERIGAALDRNRGRVADAAAELRVHPATVYRHLRRTNRPRPRDAKPPPGP